ncbi:MAG TPA: NAD(P)-dependent glycerol-1-phosphate dehydrogenase [Candidatus Thermoplasmatota archaeon]|nr:NAD(P)-dependent glycerol-1-phosphate dehydrogenase [Candidatus Thermoplasmatota archaeon]
MEDFTKSKTMVFPRDVRVGHGVLEELGDVLDQLDVGERVLLVTGGHTRKLAGERAAEVVRKAGYEPTLVEIGGATLHDVAIVELEGRRVKPSALMGVGGGSIIDVAKLAAYRLKVPFVSVPTNAAHDGITSPRASIKEDKGNASKEANTPWAIVADTGVIAQAPYRMLAAGCADAISNSTAVLDWRLAHRLRGEEYSSFAATLAESAADLVMKSAGLIRPGLEESSWIVVKSLIVSGVSMSVAGSSRPASGSEHMFSHTLDQLAPGVAYHGEQVGIGSIMMMYLHGGDWRGIRDALSQVGAPTTAKAVGLSRELVVEALVRAHLNKPDRYTILGDKGLSREAAEELVRVTGVA